MQLLASAQETPRPRVDVGRVRLDVVDGRDVRAVLRPLLAREGCQHVVTANADYLRLAHRDERLPEILDAAALVVPDGMPVVWAARLRGAPVSRRITGHDLTEALCRLSAEDGFGLFLMGAAPEIAERAGETMRRRWPGARIAGTYSPPAAEYPFPPDEDRRMVEMVNGSGARALLLALGCPKAELWIDAHRHELKPSLAVGVGSVFDVLAGVTGRAPKAMQSTGLEWLYRMWKEPRRLTARYARDAVFLLPLFYGCAWSRLTSGRVEVEA